MEQTHLSPLAARNGPKYTRQKRAISDSPSYIPPTDPNWDRNGES